MVILALDTTTASGSMALAREATLVRAHAGEAGRTHGERLPGELIELLAAESLTLKDVDAYAVCTGPGSFTGLRVGLATIQGLALVHHRPVVPIPTLEALAWAAIWHGNAAQPVMAGAWMNAHRGEVFAALYDTPSSVQTTDPAGSARWMPLRPLSQPGVGAPAALAAGWKHALRRDPAPTAVVAGDAVDQATELLETTLGRGVSLVTDVPPLAGVAARIAAAVLASGESVTPHALQPIYVRRPDAELARERRRARDASTRT